MSRSPRTGLTVAESDPPRLPGPPRGRGPNVVVVLLDDLGFGQLGCFGSDVATPNIDGLAAGGLRYNRFHVTALCSPTRASLLTGQNHHAAGMGFLADIPTAWPGYTARIPDRTATLARILADAGWSTLAVGKWHLVPRGERGHAGPFDRWPLGLGFERYYGFLRGDANHWAPELVRDNHYVEPPARPEDGYHLSEDLAKTAVRMIVDQKQSAPDKPFFLYFATGAMHAPHHVANRWVAPYEGAFDKGWDAWREEVFSRQRAAGVVPKQTTITPRPSWVPAWNALGGDERRLFARMHEVYAGFLTHIDAQIGKIVAALESLALLEDTLLLVLSDNGASAEGGVSGTWNELRFSHRIPDSIQQNLARIPDWGGFRGYPHYAWGWAWAGNCPFHLWKRYTWLGGTRVPLIVHWPKGLGGARGEVRGQFAHVVDLAPTILDACGVAAPAEVRGVPQRPMDGASLLPTFTEPAAPAPRNTQYFEILGSRAIVDGEWKATTDHVSQGVADEEERLVGSRDFAADHWSLFRLDRDFAEAHDLAEAHPEVVARLERLWLDEAERNDVLPMADGLTARLKGFLGGPHPPRPRSVFLPAGSAVPEDAVPLLAGGGRIHAEVEAPDGAAEGVLCAIGDWTNGFALYVKDGRLHAALNVGGDCAIARAEGALRPGRRTLGCVLRPAPGGAGAELELFDGDATVGRATAPHRLPFAWQHGGTSLSLGRDRGFPVCDDYAVPFPWTGTLFRVVVEAGAVAPPDLEELRAALGVE